jgi:hypothetical protein
MSARELATWKGDRLYLSNRLSGYSIVPDERYPSMWRVRHPDGSLSDMINRTRAKDAAMAMLDRDLRHAHSPTEAPPVR